MSVPVYLDYNATAPTRPQAIAAVSAALSEIGNPSSVHRFGRVARRTVEAARDRIAALVGAAPRQLIFTSGGTEANNLAVVGTGRRPVVAAIEHDSVLRPAQGAVLVPAGRDGCIDVAALDRLLAADPAPALVAVMLANNETGVVQPIADVVRIAHAHGARVHCDAVQAAGKIPVDFVALGVDTMALSAHKLGGPPGIGALVVADNIVLRPLVSGGGQERGRRAGTENVPAIAGFGVAAELALHDLGRMADLARMRDDLERRIASIAPDAVIIGAGATRLPNTSCLALPGVLAETQVMALDLAGIAVSAGSACSSGKVRTSHVLEAMGLGPDLAGSAIRISAGWATTPEDFDRFFEAWVTFRGRLHARQSCPESPAA
jgi:cysteine desulfurase